MKCENPNCQKEITPETEFSIDSGKIGTKEVHHYCSVECYNKMNPLDVEQLRKDLLKDMMRRELTLATRITELEGKNAALEKEKFELKQQLKQKGEATPLYGMLKDLWTTLDHLNGANRESVSTEKVYDAYRAWCINNNKSIPTPQTIRRRLVELNQNGWARRIRGAVGASDVELWVAIKK